MLKNKNAEIELFNDIEINEKFSQVGKKLHLLVGDNCFENFYDKIQNPVRIRVRNSISLLSENNPRLVKSQSYSQFNENNFKKFLHEEKRKESIKKKNHIVKILTNERTLRNLENQKKFENQKGINPMWKYNPKYDYVKEKIPCALIPSIKESTGNNKKGNNDSNKSIHSSLNNSPKIIKKGIKFHKKKKVFMNFSQLQNKSSSQPHSKRDQSKDNNLSNHSNNHSKEKTKKRNKQTKRLSNSSSLPILTEKKINNAIDFNKMGKEDRDIFNLQLNKEETCFLKGPSVGVYQPNYDSILKIFPKISINDNKPKPPSKKYLMQKLWSSFSNTSAKYEIVNFPEINNIKDE